MTSVQSINDPFDLTSTTSSLPPTSLLVLYFHAPWAAPCAQMSEVLSALASTYAPTTPPSIAFASVNAEDLPDIAEEHDVTAVPYFVLQRDGKTVDTLSGGDASKLREMVEKHANPDGGRGAGSKRHEIPPAQTVTRPKEQPVTVDAKSSKSNGAPDAISKQTDTSDAPPAKNLSAYAPTSSDHATAPEYSSGQALPSDPAAPSSNDPTDPNSEIHKRLSQLVKAAPAMLFMKGTPSAPQCGFSRQLVAILRENGVRYGFFNILADDEVRQGLKTFAEWPTFPQLWLGGELVGGLDIVKEELEGDKTFFAEYAVPEKGGPAAPDRQAGTVAT